MTEIKMRYLEISKNFNIIGIKNTLIPKNVINIYLILVLNTLCDYPEF